MAFISSGADAKPTLFCIGEIAEVEATRPSKSGEYYVTTFKINPLGSANQKATVWMTWHPEFLRPGYNTMKEESNAMKMLYDSNIIREHKGFNVHSSEYGKTQTVGLATLQGMCGSEERFIEVATQLQEAFSESPDAETLVEKVDVIFQSLVGNTVGYCLKQQWVKTDAVNDKGYAVKVRGKYYEVAGLFYATEGELAKINKAVEKAKDKDASTQVWVCFDNEVPFSTAG